MRSFEAVDFTGFGGARVRAKERGLLPSAFPALNAQLGGGLPIGAITEIFGTVSSGRTTFAHVVVAGVIHRGGFVAWIDVPNAFDPAGARSAGIDLTRVLWITPHDHVVAVRAVEHVLDAGGFRIVVLDLGDSSTKPRLPASVWLRMNRAAAQRDAAIIVLDVVRPTGSFATLTLETRASRRIFIGQDGPSPVFEGASSLLRVHKHKFGPPADAPIRVFASMKE